MCRTRTVLVAAALAALFSTAAGAATLPGTTHKADRAAWQSLLHWPASCQRDWNQPGVATSLGGAGVETYPASGRTLAIIDCYFGAYQGTFMLYLVDSSGKPTGPLSLDLYEGSGSGASRAVHLKTILGVFTFAKNVLTVWDKGVGYGGCGLYSTFRLTGTTFTPLEAREKLACNGNPPHDPAKWPKLPTPGP